MSGNIYQLRSGASASIRDLPNPSATVISSAKSNTHYYTSGRVSNNMMELTSPVRGWVNPIYFKITTKASETESSKAIIERTIEQTAANKAQVNTINSINAYTPTSGTTTDDRTYWKYTRAFGCPPHFSPKVDIPYTQNITASSGRVFGKTLLSNPTILSLCPGNADFLPGFSLDAKTEFYNTVIGSVSGAVKEKISATPESDRLDGKLYEFKQDYTGYVNTVNVLCRTVALYLGIGDETIPGGRVKLKNFDYAWWTTPSEAKNSSDKSIFSSTLTNLSNTLSGAVTDNTYIHFFIVNQGTSISEDISTSVTASMLEGIVNDSSMNSMARNIEYIFNDFAGDKAEMLANMGSSAMGNSEMVKSFGYLAGNYLKGGRMVFPQMVDNVSYSKSISCSAKFISPYGDKVSIFLRCYVPIMHLLAFSLPKQISSNMYTYPFLVRAFQKGWFNTDLGVMTNLRITRGGEDNTAWTVDGLSTEWEAQFDILPMYSELMASSADHPFLFMQNSSLIEYLATYCGLDIKMNNLTTKIEQAGNLISNRFTDIPVSFAREITEGLANSISSIFQIQNR